MTTRIVTRCYSPRHSPRKMSSHGSHDGTPAVSRRPHVNKCSPPKKRQPITHTGGEGVGYVHDKVKEFQNWYENVKKDWAAEEKVHQDRERILNKNQAARDKNHDTKVALKLHPAARRERQNRLVREREGERQIQKNALEKALEGERQMQMDALGKALERERDALKN